MTNSPKSPPVLLLPVETKSRELAGKTLLACIAAEQGYRVVLGEQNAMYKRLATLPAGVYVEKVLTRTQAIRLRNFKAMGNAIVGWCEEGLVYRDKTTYLRERMHEDAVDTVDRLLTWGDRQRADILSKYAERAADIITTGNPRFDLLRPEYRDFFKAEADRIRSRHGPFILINSNFGRVNHIQGHDHAIELIRARGTISNEDDYAFAMSWSDFQWSVFEGFKAVLPALGRAFPDHKIIVRPHPSENFNSWQSAADGLANVEVICEGAAIPWILASELVMHNSCTTAVEAYILGIPPIAYLPVTSDVFDTKLPQGVSVQTFDEQELVNGIRDILAGGRDAGHTDERDAFLEEYLSGQTGPAACDRVMEVIRNLAPERLTPVQHYIGRLRIAAFALASRLYRPFNKGHSSEAYQLQKFPGLEPAELRQLIGELGRVSGRFKGVTVEPLAANLMTITDADRKAPEIG